MPFRYDCTQWSEELTQQFSLWPGQPPPGEGTNMCQGKEGWEGA